MGKLLPLQKMNQIYNNPHSSGEEEQTPFTLDITIQCLYEKAYGISGLSQN